MLKKTYMQEFTVEDHIGLSSIQELRVYRNDTYCINGFSFHEINKTVEYMCTK